MRRVFLSVLATVFVTTSLFAVPRQVSDFRDRLDAIEDATLRRTLENSIAAGIIETDHDFTSAVSQAESIANNGSPVYYTAYNASRNISSIRAAIQEMAAPLASLDREALKVVKNKDYRVARLFLDVEGNIPASYKKAIELCEKFDPKNGTNDHSRINAEIDSFLDSIKNDPTIVRALKSTGTDMAALKKNWFGTGRGFEHVVAGELDGKKISGYHWWYKFYHDEREGNALVKSAVSGIGNPRIYTGSFYWDPDGAEGPLPSAYKPKGGFINGNSVQVMLALGHIAMEAAKQFGAVPGALTFTADINGEAFNWQLYTMGGTIRSLYPIGNKKGDVNPPGEEEVYYNIKK